jgi:hypothetical protein
MIDKENQKREWALDVKGEIYEGLLRKRFEEQKRFGQYFTFPHPDLGNGRVHPPETHENDADPACGTGGLSAAYDFLLVLQLQARSRSNPLSKTAPLVGRKRIVQSAPAASLMNSYFWAQHRRDITVA